MTAINEIEAALLAALPGAGPHEPGSVIDAVKQQVRQPHDRVVGVLWTLVEEGQIEVLLDRRMRRAGVTRRQEIEALSPELRRDLELLCVLASNPENERGITESRAREILGCSVPEFRALVRRWEKE